MSTISDLTGLFIGGEWLQTQSKLSVMDPAAMTVLAEIGDAGVAEGLDAVSAAHGAFQTWSQSAPMLRCRRA